MPSFIYLETMLYVLQVVSVSEFYNALPSGNASLVKLTLFPLVFYKILTASLERLFMHFIYFLIGVCLFGIIIYANHIILID